jgi:hypothetical protein
MSKRLEKLSNYINWVWQSTLSQLMAWNLI